MNNTPNNMMPGNQPYGGMPPYPQGGQMDPRMANNPYPQAGQVPMPNPTMPGMNVPTPAPMGQQGFPKKKKAPKSNKRWIILGIFAGIGLIFGGILFSIVNKYTKQTTVIELPGAPIVDSSVGSYNFTDDNGGGEIVEAAAVLDASQLTTEKGEGWDGSTRITCLAMGLDYRDWLENDGAPRSDSMMLLTYDPVTNLAGMLSIPRDLWVAIPDHGYGRINTAYAMGEQEQLPGTNGKPGGGAGLAMRTVELFLGIDIQYYAVINFNGFIRFIDTIDKLAINVREDITVGYEEGEEIHLMAGVQDLDGKTALKYARYRYTQGGDFERAQRQQDVIEAIFEQVVWQLPELLTTKADALFSCIQEAVKTNLTLPDMIKLGWTITELNRYYITRSVIAPPYQVEYNNSVDGQQILVPIPDKIREARDAVFFNHEISGAQITDDFTEVDRLKAEGARITLINGSTQAGLVERTAEYLNQFGITTVNIASGSQGYANAMEIKTGKPYAAKLIANVMNIPTSSITMNYEPGSDVDLVVTITDAWANSNPM